MRRTWCAGAFAVTVLVSAAWEAWGEVAPPPRPPAGWESEVAPGLTPSIESVVIKISDDRYVRSATADADAKLAAYWEGWGADAVPVVTGLYEDPRWKEFRNAALQLLVASPLPEAAAYVEDRIRLLADNDSPEEQEVRELGALCNMLAIHHPNKAWPILQDIAASDAETTLKAVAHTFLLLRTEEGIAGAKKIIARLPEESRKHLVYSLEYAEAQARANEPMDRILRTEAATRGESK